MCWACLLSLVTWKVTWDNLCLNWCQINEVYWVNIPSLSDWIPTHSWHAQLLLCTNRKIDSESPPMTDSTLHYWLTTSSAKAPELWSLTRKAAGCNMWHTLSFRLQPKHPEGFQISAGVRGGGILRQTVSHHTLNITVDSVMLQFSAFWFECSAV